MGESREMPRVENKANIPGGMPAGSEAAPAGSRPLSVGEYFVMFFLFGIPVVNLILMLVWGFGGDVNINRKNCARAYLILLLVSVSMAVILVLAGVLLAGHLGPLVRDLAGVME